MTSRRAFLLGASLALAGRAAAGRATESPRAVALVTAGPGRILGPGPRGWWDEERVSCPRVLRGDDGRWRMWYYGRDPRFDRRLNLPAGRSGLAESQDGIRWQRVRGPLTMGAVLEPSAAAASFDSGFAGITDVQRTDTGYLAWYIGGSRMPAPGAKDGRIGLPVRAGRARSPDGLHWTKEDGPHAGAILDVGPPGSFDALVVGWPQALRESDGHFKLYYHTFLPGEGFKVCLAVSSDGRNWEKLGPVLARGAAGDFDENGPATRQVLRHGSEYWMFYEGMHGARNASIGLARSADGVAWTKVRGPEAGGAILARAPSGSGRWDAEGVGTPWVVPDAAGRFNMYYVGVNENPRPPREGIDELGVTHQIGLALAAQADPTRWRRHDG